MTTERYTQHEILGRGGMGVVHRATDRLTNQIVALKQVITTTPLQQTASAASASTNALNLALAREFSTLASLRHPNIISVLDYGFDSEQRPFFTMTYLQHAKTFLEAAVGLSLQEQVQLVQQMLQALVYLHRRGILHRDLKPENVLVTEKRVRVLDFGLAAAKEEAVESVGTWLYAAPEIIEGQAASEAADLYAVGILAYRIFHGHHPFDIYAADYLDQVLFDPPDLTPFGDQKALADVVGKLLAKKPHDRFASAQAAIIAFGEAVGLPLPQEQTAVRESFLQAAQFVGRAKEMKQLQTAMNQARHGQGSTWLIGGESGVGKSRLLDEIRTQALVSGALVLHGQGQESSSDLPYQLWQDVIRRLVLGSTLSNLAMSVLQPLIPDIGTLLAQTVVPAPELEGTAGRQRLISTITSLFSQQSQWMLLILEDLHWAQESLDVLNQLNRLVAHLPLLIIGSYRHDEQPSLPTELPLMQTIQLERFTVNDMTQLSMAMLGEIGTKPEILTLLQQETEGNAFFLVEVVRALAEEAGRLSDVGQMTLPNTVFPKGIETIVHRRLAQVSPDVQRLLLGTAVAGRQVDPAIVQQLAQQQQIPLDIETWFATCAEAAILHVHENTWRFVHDKIRTGILSSLTEPEQQKWHTQIAQAIEVAYPSEPAQAASLVYHWHHAGNIDKERHFAPVAGQYASDRFANTEAIFYYNRALELTPEADKLGKFNLLRAREKIFGLIGDRTQQQQDVEQLTQLANILPNQEGEERQIEVALLQAHFAEATSDYAGAIAAARQSILLAQKAHNLHGEMAGELIWCRALISQAEYETVRQRLQTVLAKAQEHNLKEIEAEACLALGILETDFGNLHEAHTFYDNGILLFQEINNQGRAARILNNLAVIAYSQGDYVKAMEAWEQAKQIYEKMGDREWVSRAIVNLSIVYMGLGQYETATAYSEEARQICREIGTRFGECYTLLNLSWIHYAQRGFETAVNYATQARQLAEGIGVSRYLAYGLMYSGHALKELHQYSAANTDYHAALAHWKEINQKQPLLETYAGLARLALAQNDLTTAQEYANHILQDETVTTAQDDNTLLEVLLTCFQILDATKDKRANNILKVAYQLLLTCANVITNETLRLSFLHNIRFHQEILDLAQAKQL